MFARIVRSYDIGNDVLSFGTHRLWKKRLVLSSTPGAGGTVLDLATGTGDIAFLYADTVGVHGHVVGIDFCSDMIDYARGRSRIARSNLTFEVGDAMQLAFPDDSFDTTSISFGIRNVDDPVTVLREMTRVTRPGGTVAILETGQPGGLWGLLYRAYARTLLPLVGGLLSGSFSAYSYLNRTATRFPYGDRFADLMRSVGLDHIQTHPFLGGIAFMYTATVVADALRSVESVQDVMEAQ